MHQWQIYRGVVGGGGGLSGLQPPSFLPICWLVYYLYILLSTLPCMYHQLNDSTHPMDFYMTSDFFKSS